MTGRSRVDASVVVGITTHNRASELRKAIKSALEQNHAPLRVAVIDDASNDGTPALRDEFKTVSWERWEQQQGLVRARNRMMLTASEDYFVSVDDDAWFMRDDEITVAVAFLQQHSEAAAVAFDILSPDRPHPVARGTRQSVAMFIGCGHVLRLSVVKQLGGYAELPGAYGAEEKDLCLRLIDRGYQIIKCDGVHVWHDKSTSARDLPRQHCSGVCNDLALTLRNVPLGFLFPMLAWKISSHIAFALRMGMLRPCLQGFRDFAGAAAGVWRGRRPVRLSSLAQYRALTRSPRQFVG
jgi:GT2 family glycosyltransferase